MQNLSRQIRVNESSQDQLSQLKINSQNEVNNRRRSNSQSQVVPLSTGQSDHLASIPNRNQITYFITLEPLNDTFAKKHLLIPYYPDTRRLGRPAGSKVKPEPTNGFFDSRVLSRSHAALFVNPGGKIMIKDLGSSNGTYVNGNKIGTDPVEIKIGDNISLGFNIQTDTNHKQISARIENINLIQNFYNANLKGMGSANLDTPEFQYYSFIQDIMSSVNINDPNKAYEESNSFEKAFFADVCPELDASALGLSDGRNISIDYQISNPSFENIFRILRTALVKLKQDNYTLDTFESFIEAYQAKLDELNTSDTQEKCNEKNRNLEEKIECLISLEKLLRENLSLLKEEHAKGTKSLCEQVSQLKSENEKLRQIIKENGILDPTQRLKMNSFEDLGVWRDHSELPSSDSSIRGDLINSGRARKEHCSNSCFHCDEHKEKFDQKERIINNGVENSQQHSAQKKDTSEKEPIKDSNLNCDSNSTSSDKIIKSEKKTSNAFGLFLGLMILLVALLLPRLIILMSCT